MEKEHCIECDRETGKGGVYDDSIYLGSSGPFCEECYGTVYDIRLADLVAREVEIARLRVLVKSGFAEAALMVLGYDEVTLTVVGKIIDNWWEDSATKAALTGEEE